MTTHILDRVDKLDARTLGVSITLLGAFLMSLDPIFIRLSGVSGFETAFLFGLFTAISMAAFIQFKAPDSLMKTITTNGWPLLISGLLMLVSALSLVLSITNTSIANTFVILSASPALAAVFSWIFLKEATSRSTWIAIVAVMLGITIVVSGSFKSGHMFGDMLALIAAVFIALNQVYLRKHQTVSRMASVGVGGFLMAFATFFIAEPSSFSLSTWLIMAIMGLFSAPFGRVLSQVATRYISAPEVGMFLMIEAVLAPLWALMFFKEVPKVESILGGSVILLAIFSYILLSKNSTNEGVNNE
jgi:drug/metabolite transporter (DMT)-like permease